MGDSPEAAEGEKVQRQPRPHPYADEVSTDEELAYDPKRVTIIWLILATALAGLGLTLSSLYSPHVQGAHHVLDREWFAWWDNVNVGLLMIGLVLLGLRAWLPNKTWTHKLAIPGWGLYGFYWAMTARDLFIEEGSDYVNSIAAVLAAYLVAYFAYHEWLNIVRKVPNLALEFMRKTAVIASGSYFLIAYIVPLRIGLIKLVGGQTNGVINMFGGRHDIHFELRDAYTDRLGPVSFWYNDTKNMCPDGTSPVRNGVDAPCLNAYEGLGNWFQDLIFYIPDALKIDVPGVADGLEIVPVSIILACTAIQSIMLFVGMFVGTPNANWRRKLQFSVGVGVAIYVLNLIRNAGIIFLYGRGHTSFWFIHNFVAKIVTLSALVGIAYVCFRGFPEFFRALGNVLDLPQRDGPLERTLRLGKRRPEAAPAEPIAELE
jgi:exosortase/archaeosortase family protein